MKLAEVQFENEKDRDKAALAIIAIRENHPEPSFKRRNPSLMVWESEREEFERQMRQQGVPYHVDHETEIGEAQLVNA